MRTLADFKRRLTVGAAIHIENHMYPAISRDTEVTIAQSAKFATRLHRDGKTIDSWMQLPKAGDVEIVDDNSARFYESDNDRRTPLATITFL